MLTTSTHDTKRSEDVRVRIALLSEVPGEWIAAVRNWAKHNDRHRDGSALPERATEYLLYQTLVGVWPITEERLVGYMQKAAREAKLHTSWTRPNATYESALASFCTRVIGDTGFVQQLETFLGPLEAAARTNALSQVLLKLCAPGVPDIYQGNELWDYSLTDPDNRRPIDFDLRGRLLDELVTLETGDILARSEEGLPKLWVTYHALRLRRDRPHALGTRGDYRSLEASGAHKHHVIAFLRGREVIAVAPRLTLRLGSWDDTALPLPTGGWRNVLTKQRGLRGDVRLHEILAGFPVALLESEG